MLGGLCTTRFGSLLLVLDLTEMFLCFRLSGWLDDMGRGYNFQKLLIISVCSCAFSRRRRGKFDKWRPFRRSWGSRPFFFAFASRFILLIAWGIIIVILSARFWRVTFTALEDTFLSAVKIYKRAASSRGKNGFSFFRRSNDNDWSLRRRALQDGFLVRPIYAYRNRETKAEKAARFRVVYSLPGEVSWIGWIED